MKWTKEKPKKVGWYAVYHEEVREAGLLELNDQRALKEIQVECYENDCLFFGPIPSPESEVRDEG